jgi:hypothetical protein
MLTNEMPVIGENALGNVYGVVDTVALNPVGSLWMIPAASVQGGLTLPTTHGYGSFLTVKYLQYKSTANPAMVTGPAPVYYTDETFSTVTGRYSEGNPASTGEVCSVAGWLLPNTGTVTGIGLGTGVSAALLNGNYVFVAVEGFVPSAYILDNTNLNAAGQGIMGEAASDFGATLVTTVNRVIGYTWSAPSGSTHIGDVLATCGLF